MITEPRPARRIPAEEYEVIVDAFARGVPVKELAQEYGVSPTRIYQILKAQGIRASDYDVRAEPTGVAALIERHQAPYADLKTRLWIERTLTAWAASLEVKQCDTERPGESNPAPSPE